MTTGKAALGKLNTAEKDSIWLNENVQAIGLFLLSLALFLAFWELGANMKWFAKGMPTASKTLQELWWWSTHPFFDNG
ncbi:MAG: nitrate ABC transporter permease, partial [Phormidesmis sp.]